jgi:hypothetical protein
MMKELEKRKGDLINLESMEEPTRAINQERVFGGSN